MFADSFSYFANKLRTNFTSRRTYVRLRVTHGKPWFSLSVLHYFSALSISQKNSVQIERCFLAKLFFVSTFSLFNNLVNFFESNRNIINKLIKGSVA